MSKTTQNNTKQTTVKNSVLKVNTQNQKVLVNTNKNPIINVKGKMYNYLKTNGLLLNGSTKTKPVPVPLTTKQLDNLITFTKNTLQGLVTTKPKYNLNNQVIYSKVQNNLVGYVHRVTTIK